MIRRVSTKRAKLNRSVKLDRDDFRAGFPTCMWCGLEPTTAVHEISRGAARGNALGVREAWLALGNDCHSAMDFMPVEAQLAIKKICDPYHYDRVKVNELRGRQPNAITEAEVDRWVARLRVGAA